jgi:dTMP kinase
MRFSSALRLILRAVRIDAGQPLVQVQQSLDTLIPNLLELIRG